MCNRSGMQGPAMNAEVCHRSGTTRVLTCTECSGYAFDQYGSNVMLGCKCFEGCMMGLDHVCKHDRDSDHAAGNSAELHVAYSCKRRDQQHHCNFYISSTQLFLKYLRTKASKAPGRPSVLDILFI